MITTLRADLQQVAKQALGEREGSMVLLDPRSSAIKALWSYPSYDLNLIASHNFEEATAVKTFYDAAPASRCWPTATRSATSRAPRSRW